MLKLDEIINFRSSRMLREDKDLIKKKETICLQIVSELVEALIRMEPTMDKHKLYTQAYFYAHLLQVFSSDYKTVLRSMLEIIAQTPIVQAKPPTLPYIKSKLKNIIPFHIKQFAQNANIKASQLDFTQTFNWNAGDFGDRGSCYWSDRAKARTQMKNDGNYYAMRLYKRANKKTGKGRCWMYHLNNATRNSLPTYIIFNAYGPRLEEFAQLLTEYLQYTTKVKYVAKRVQLTNRAGRLYINQSRGYIICLEKSINQYKNKNSYDFRSSI